jgi:hypothetical protein
MGDGMTSKSKCSWNRWVLAAMLGTTLVLGTSGLSARAEDDEEFELPDTKFWNSFMHSMGFRKDGDQIEYRERAPLVLPPSRDLPPPDKNAKTKTASWPDDPDVKRLKRAKAERKFSNPEPEDAGRPLMPNQYSLPGGASPGSRPTGPSKTIEDHDRPMTPYELGSKSIFSSWWGWGGNKEEYTTFTTEPPRDRLVDPPTGYRTPSPNQPYGVGKSTFSSNQTPVERRNDAVK